MAYSPIFVQSSKVVSKINKSNITSISDEDMESGELRVIIDLADPVVPIGVESLSYSMLLACDSVWFQPLLEQAAMYAVISELNGNGKGNSVIGPVTSVSGDGMAKTAGYYNGKTVSNDVLVGAEEKYLKLMRSILRSYRARCMTKKILAHNSNSFYNKDYNRNRRDERLQDTDVEP